LSRTRPHDGSGIVAGRLRVPKRKSVIDLSHLGGPAIAMYERVFRSLTPPSGSVRP
jgi:hypothetical protein